MIVPGFVNAHSHLEYAVYAGFGDGLPFVPWIGLHIQRKAALDLDDMVAIATVGAHECLRSGITTVGDCSFSGAAATAAAATGLRAVVYLEVFGRDASALDRFHEAHARIEPVLSDRVQVGISPHAPYTCAIEVYHGRAQRWGCRCPGNAFARELLPSATGSWTARGTGRRSPISSSLRPA